MSLNPIQEVYCNKPALGDKILKTNRSHLHHLQLNVLWLGQAAACCLRHRNVLDSLVISLCCAIVSGQVLRKLRHSLGQQVCGLQRE